MYRALAPRRPAHEYNVHILVRVNNVPRVLRRVRRVDAYVLLVFRRAGEPTLDLLAYCSDIVSGVVVTFYVCLQEIEERI